MGRALVEFLKEGGHHTLCKRSNVFQGQLLRHTAEMKGARQCGEAHFLLPTVDGIDTALRVPRYEKSPLHLGVKIPLSAQPPIRVSCLMGRVIILYIWSSLPYCLVHAICHIDMELTENFSSPMPSFG